MPGIQVETRMRMQNILRTQTRPSAWQEIDEDVLDVLEDRASGRKQRYVLALCNDMTC